MSINSKYIQVHPDAIVEWIWDDNNFVTDDYSIITDVKNNEISFTFSGTSNNNNNITNQLYLLDGVINKFGVVNTETKPFLQEVQYINNQPSKFNIVKIWFPIYYNFKSYTGFYLNTYANNYNNNKKLNLSNFFIDITNQNDFNKIVNESKPFRFNDKLWGKSITIMVPSVYDEALNRNQNIPLAGSINSNLGLKYNGFSQISPIYIDFRFLENKQIILNETTFNTTTQLLTNIPQSPEYNTLSVKIEKAIDGDYFVINGVYNNSVGEFVNFMNSLESAGRRSYILYAITVYEDNIPQNTKEIYVYEDFINGIDDYRPVLKYTNTLASIRVDMKLISSVDNSIVIKSTEYTLTGNEVTKYGKLMTPINISGAIKPKIYNSKPDQIILPSKELVDTQMRRKLAKLVDVKYIPYPVLIDTFNLVIQNVSSTVNDTLYYGNGDLNIDISPFDNVFKFFINKKINEDTFEPFQIPVANTFIQMVFKTNSNELKIPLYLDSQDVNLANGIIAFKITKSNVEQLKNIFKLTNKFYITLITNDIETKLYQGTFNLLSENSILPVRQPQFLTALGPALNLGKLIDAINKNSTPKYTINNKKLN